MKCEIGAICALRGDGPCFTQIRSAGLSVCQLCSWSPALWSDALARRVRLESQAQGVRIAALWAGYSGPGVWNFTEGPSTLGLVPAQYRASRARELKQAAAFAHALGTPAMITHLGFIPENPSDEDFSGIVAAVRDIAECCKSLGLEFWFETGQETPVTLLRLIQAVGLDNLGINLDPANLLMYGKGNPIDALEVFGPYVRNVHVKDGLYPTNPMELGREVKVGLGRVRYPEFIARLQEIGFTGELIIEREIEGEQQQKDILETIQYVKGLLR